MTTEALIPSGGPPPARDSTAILEVENLRTEFDTRNGIVRAVDGVSFSVARGECVGLVGELGCGKSTTGLSIMRLLAGSGHVAGGSIRLDGRDLVTLTDREMRDVRGNEVGMIFQDPMTSLDPTMPIGRQIAETVQLHRRVSRSDAMERAFEVLQLVGMPRPRERLRYYPHQLSGGLRQRVVIAMALACEPKLLIADEPTTALDVAIQAQILDLIDDLRTRLHMAVILVTHDMGVISARTDRVMVMYAGKVVEASSTPELFTTLRHPYTEALLASIPRIDQDRTERLFSIPGIPPDLSRELVGCRFAPRCRYASDDCRAEEPLLAPGLDTPSPSAGAGNTSEAAVLGAESGIVHVFACFHPIGTEHGAQGIAHDKRQAEIAVAQGDLGKIADDIVVALTPTAPEPAPAERETVLVVDHAVKEYPAGGSNILSLSGGDRVVHAVSDVSFSLGRGQTFGLVGESGCGKTTMGRLIVGLEWPTSGRVTFEGDDLSKMHGATLRRRRRELQLMFQDPYASLDPRMRVGDIIREPLHIQKVGNKHEQRERVQELLVEVGLPAAASIRFAHEFSGGQRQRIGLARALALKPRLIVADEPVSALDVSIQAQILNLMRALQERHQLTYIVISHDLAVVRYLADHIGVMYLGKLVEIGPGQEVYSNAAHPYTQGLIDTIPDPDPNVTRGQRAAIKGDLPSAIDPPSGCRFRTRCPRAQEICAAQEPPMRPFGQGHHAACHFPLQEPIAEAPSDLTSAPIGS